MTRERQAGRREDDVKISCLCPYCGAGNRVAMADAANAECFTCRRRFRILTGNDGRVTTVHQIPEPLHLPRGSVRALATLLAAGTCWLLAWRGQPIPGTLLGLLLAMIGYYFGFRRGDGVPAAAGADDGGGGAPARMVVQPLHLPGGSIRLLLVAGFLLTACWLASRQRLLEPEVVEFYAIFLGLVLGHWFGRFTARFAGSPGAILSNHVKGGVVLAAALALAALLLAGFGTEATGTWPVLGLSCLISFYFGSR